MGIRRFGSVAIARKVPGYAAAFGWLCAGMAAGYAAEPVDVTTHHYDSMRTGWNSSETKLSPSTIKNGSFGLLKTIALDEQIDAQPLIVSNLQIAGESHQIAYVVTENNTVYAIDVPSGSILQQRNLGTPVTATGGGPVKPNGLIQCGNNASNIGITSTPVIDRDSNSLYLIAYTAENDQPIYKIYALDLASLADKLPPQAITATSTLSDGSTYSFIAKVTRQRPALALSNDKKTVYAAFGSFCDHDVSVSRGWIMGWDAKFLSPIAGVVSDRRAAAPNNWFLTAIWMSGSGPAIDAEGNIFFITGNSKTLSDSDIDPNKTMRDSVIKMRSDLSGVLDFFTPMDIGGQHGLEDDDVDFGSGAALLIPDRPGSSAHLAVAAGKSGDMFLLDRDNLGKFNETKNHVLDTQTIGQCWCGQSYFVGEDGIGRVLSSGGNQLTSWKVGTVPKPSLIKEWDASASFTTHVFQKGFFTSISSDGVKPGTAVVWAVERPTSAPPTLTLWAFDASSGEKLGAASAGNWPNTGGAANAVPVVANGNVFVASYRALMIFGLGAPVAVAATLAATQATVAAAAAPRKTVLYGTVVQQDGSTLWLRTRKDMTFVDISAARSSGNAGVGLRPGTALEVIGLLQPGGGVQAESLSYPDASEALWPADE
jgi:hypothetical protein